MRTTNTEDKIDINHVVYRRNSVCVKTCTIAKYRVEIYDHNKLSGIVK